MAGANSPASDAPPKRLTVTFSSLEEDKVLGSESTSRIRGWFQRTAQLVADCGRASWDWWLTLREFDPRFHLVRCPPDTPGAVLVPKGLPRRVFPELARLLWAPDREEERNQVLQNVERLNPDQRKFLKLHIEEDLTYRAIANQTGLSADFVLKQLTTAYAQLRMWQFEQDAAAEPAAEAAIDDVQERQ